MTTARGRQQIPEPSARRDPAPLPDPSQPSRTRARVLIVDDEPALLRALSINLRARNYDIATARAGRDALAQAARRPPDAVILDLGLPDIDGVEVIRELRRWSRAPIIVLSGRTGPGDKIGALDDGADDYVTKPFAMAELLARLRAALRRDDADPAEAQVIIGQHLIDLGAHTVTRRTGAAVTAVTADASTVTRRTGPASAAAADGDGGGRPDSGQRAGAGTDPALGAAADASASPRADAGAGSGANPDGSADTGTIRLTPTEWRLLEMLLQYPGRLVSAQLLLAEVWGPGFEARTNYLRFHMARLRRKLEEDPSRPKHLLTEPGMGYRYQP
jgi:two-component system KDP operon response regulator KdpE